MRVTTSAMRRDSYIQKLIWNSPLKVVVEVISPCCNKPNEIIPASTSFNYLWVVTIHIVNISFKIKCIVVEITRQMISYLLRYDHFSLSLLF